MVQTRNNSTDPPAACCGDIADFLEARFFKALCDPSRIRILAELVEGGEARTVGAIAAGLPLDVSVVSRHLAVLREAGIVAAEKRGREVHYTVRYQALAGTLREMAEAITACCPPAARQEQEERYERARGRP